MTRAAIIELVKARLDELSPFASVEINDALNMIDKLLDESTETVLLYYPLHLLESEEMTTTLVVSPNLSAKMPLDDDFLRLAAFSLSSWAETVHQVITPAHPAYALQKNIYTRGGSINPVIVLKDRVLHIYSASAEDDTASVKQYIKKQKPEEITDDSVLSIVAWQCVADIALATGKIGLLPLVKEKLKELNYVRS